MAGPVPREQYPWWVKVGLWGLPNRATVWAFVWLSVLAAVGCVIYAVLAQATRLYAGVLFLFAALMYYLAIRWVDRYGSWERDHA